MLSDFKAKMEENKDRVCVTGAGGYLGSWLVTLLLSDGYKVHATVRDPDDDKNSHLRRAENAIENLQLFKADLLDYESLRRAISGCRGVFHVSCPVPQGATPNPEIELVEPAVTGTMNVLKACSEAGVKRVICVSSIQAVVMNPNWPQDKVMDEDCWSDAEYCKTITDPYAWYSVAKTMAERNALEYGEKNELDVITVCPAWIIGPLLQTTINSSSIHMINLMKGKFQTIENRVHAIVDVRDVADALLLTYEKPQASGRYICGPHLVRARDLVSKLSSMYPDYNCPKNFIEVSKEVKISSEKLKELGWRYRFLEETLAETYEYVAQHTVSKKD